MCLKVERVGYSDSLRLNFVSGLVSAKCSFRGNESQKSCWWGISTAGRDPVPASATFLGLLELLLWSDTFSTLLLKTVRDSVSSMNVAATLMWSETCNPEANMNDYMCGRININTMVLRVGDAVRATPRRRAENTNTYGREWKWKQRGTKKQADFSSAKKNTWLHRHPAGPTYALYIIIVH